MGDGRTDFEKDVDHAFSLAENAGVRAASDAFMARFPDSGAHAHPEVASSVVYLIAESMQPHAEKGLERALQLYATALIRKPATKAALQAAVRSRVDKHISIMSVFGDGLLGLEAGGPFEKGELGDLIRRLRKTHAERRGLSLHREVDHHFRGLTHAEPPTFWQRHPRIEKVIWLATGAVVGVAAKALFPGG